MGKTYHIREFFKAKGCTLLQVTGQPDGSLQDQLEHFSDAVSKAFFKGAPLRPPANWKEAFRFLTDLIEKNEKKVVIFFDELPWLATRRSKLLGMINLFWNNEWSGLRNIIFVACGSSASWMLNNIIYNTGGLYNRTTVEIKLSPFNLYETKEYLAYKNIRLNEKHILSLYMALGGIPFYLNYIKRGRTAAQNIQRLFFDMNAPLANEYHKLFTSLFDSAEEYKEIIETIAKKRYGATRKEIEIACSIKGGELTNRLRKLCDAEFIREYTPLGKKRGMFYTVIDEFCYFYLSWLKNFSSKPFPPDYWEMETQRPSYFSWAGYSFEAICYKHIYQVIRVLGISSVREYVPWSYKPKSSNEEGAQIDMVIVRGDDAITLAEIKYTEKPFAIKKDYAAQLLRKIKVFRTQTKTDKQLFQVLISSNGLKETMYSEELISNVVTLQDLFNPYGQ